MRYLLYILPLFLVLIACNSTPGYVIGEDDMVSLLVDVHKGEAYVEMNSGSFYSDSLKKTFRQTIFMRHNVTQEQFDTSLMWYGHHIDQYKKVYDRVIERLEDEEKEIRLAAAREHLQRATAPICGTKIASLRFAVPKLPSYLMLQPMTISSAVMCICGHSDTSMCAGNCEYSSPSITPMAPLHSSIVLRHRKGGQNSLSRAIPPKM